MCPFCGTRLGKNAAHAAWCVERTPVRDWMYWNSVMRLLLPGVLVIVVLVLAAEWIAGGPDATEKLLSSAFLPALGILLAAGAIFAGEALWKKNAPPQQPYRQVPPQETQYRKVQYRQ
jgi:hypothetical protein